MSLKRKPNKKAGDKNESPKDESPDNDPGDEGLGYYSPNDGIGVETQPPIDKPWVSDSASREPSEDGIGLEYVVEKVTYPPDPPVKWDVDVSFQHGVYTISGEDVKKACNTLGYSDYDKARVGNLAEGKFTVDASFFRSSNYQYLQFLNRRLKEGSEERNAAEAYTGLWLGFSGDRNARKAALEAVKDKPLAGLRFDVAVKAALPFDEIILSGPDALPVYRMVMQSYGGNYVEAGKELSIRKDILEWVARPWEVDANMDSALRPLAQAVLDKVEKIRPAQHPVSPPPAVSVDPHDVGGITETQKGTDTLDAPPIP